MSQPSASLPPAAPSATPPVPLLDPADEPVLAVLVPCYNEEGAVGKVVRDFRAVLPSARIVVFDNNSTDNTVAEAEAAGAEVHRERQQGKGHVVRRMFGEIEADYYVMIDGDATYDAASVPDLIARARAERLDMVVGARKPVDGHATYRRGHVLGNRLLTGTARYLFGRGFSDMLSGYRVFSRRFVKSFPLLSKGFEIETELTIHALSLDLPCAEIDTPYYERAEGTASKLSTYRDGWRILMTMVRLFKDYKPLSFFGLIALLLALLSGLASISVFKDFAIHGHVQALASAVLSMGLMLSALLSVTCGLILDSLARQSRESKRLAYLDAAPRPRPEQR